MQLRLVLVGLAALSLLAVPAGAIDVMTPGGNDAPDVDLCAAHDAEMIAEQGGVVVETYPTATPGLTVTVKALCFIDLDPALDTDCTATSYSLTGWKWGSAYSGRVATSNPYGLTSSAIVSAFNAGGNEWDTKVGADIFGSIVAGGSASAIRKFDGVNQHGFKQGGNYVAVTYTWSSGGNAVESDAAYNTAYPWSTSGASNAMDLQNVATHELGHTFGMGHSTTASANSCLTMYPYVDYGWTHQRTLGDGDLLGIDAIY